MNSGGVWRSGAVLTLLAIAAVQMLFLDSSNNNNEAQQEYSSWAQSMFSNGLANVMEDQVETGVFKSAVAAKEGTGRNNEVENPQPPVDKPLEEPIVEPLPATEEDSSNETPSPEPVTKLELQPQQPQQPEQPEEEVKHESQQSQGESHPPPPPPPPPQPVNPEPVAPTPPQPDKDISATASDSNGVDVVLKRYAEALKKPRARFVISLTTIPPRIPYLVDVIKGISWQQVYPDAIYLSIPRHSKRFDTSYELPPFIKTNPRITVLYSDVDYGPATKLLPVLKVETDPETCIMTVDDDGFPKEHHVRLFMTAAMMFPDAALGIGGWNASCLLSRGCDVPGVMSGRGDYLFIRQSYSFACEEMYDKYGHQHCYDRVTSLYDPRPCDVIEGYEGAMYRRKFFDDSIFNFPDEPKSVFYVDDVWVSGNLALKGIPRLIILAENVPQNQLMPLPQKKVWEGPSDLAGSYEFEKRPWTDPGAIGALHSGESIDLMSANFDTANYFRSRGAW
jgi:hypothetical protein